MKNSETQSTRKYKMKGNNESFLEIEPLIGDTKSLVGY